MMLGVTTLWGTAGTDGSSRDVCIGLGRRRAERVWLRTGPWRIDGGVVLRASGANGVGWSEDEEPADATSIDPEIDTVSLL